jgi:hypothetical protein
VVSIRSRENSKVTLLSSVVVVVVAVTGDDEREHWRRAVDKAKENGPDEEGRGVRDCIRHGSIHGFLMAEEKVDMVVARSGSATLLVPDCKVGGCVSDAALAVLVDVLKRLGRRPEADAAWFIAERDRGFWREAVDVERLSWGRL